MTTIDTTDISVWLEHSERTKLSENLSKKRNEIAPMVYGDNIKACKKALKIKTVKDLANGDNLRQDHILSILHYNCKQEHDLICSNYAWTNYHDGSPVDVANNKRLTEAGEFSSELDAIADIKQLQKGTTIHQLQHENTKKNFFSFFYIVDNKPIIISLKCLGFKYRVLDASPYHDFVYGLGKLFFNDEKYFTKSSL